MQKLLQMKKDYEREGFHLQRLYKRRVKDHNGVYHTTMSKIMEPMAPRPDHPIHPPIPPEPPEEDPVWHDFDESDENEGVNWTSFV